jgi:hypothetical protein
MPRLLFAVAIYARSFVDLAALAALYPARKAGGAVFCGSVGSPVGRSLWGKPGGVGFEPARGGAPVEAAVWVLKS